jgi:hypothetical protein
VVFIALVPMRKGSSLVAPVISAAWSCQNGPGVGDAEAVKPLGRFLPGMGGLLGVFRGVCKAEHRRVVRSVTNAGGDLLDVYPVVGTSSRCITAGHQDGNASTETGHELRSVSNRVQSRLCETRPRRPHIPLCDTRPHSPPS